MDNVISIKFIKLKSKSESSQEIELVKKAVAGNHNAFIEAMKLYNTYLYRTAYLYVKDEHMAQEILQECAYKAFLSIKKLREPRYFKTWITKILINVALAYIKKNTNEVYLENDSVLYEPQGVSVEEKIDLYNSIDSLRDNYKTAIVLRYFNDMSLENISIIMDIPENTVKTYLRRAKESLSKLLKEDYFYEQ